MRIPSTAGAQIIERSRLIRGSRTAFPRCQSFRVDSPRMRILCVATKLPWPPSDGGRLALALTLQGLAEAGHEIHVVAPTHDDAPTRLDPIDGITARIVTVPRMPWPLAAARAWTRHRAISVVRHHRAEVEHAVTRALAEFCPDIVHAEQLQALANCAPALSAGISVVLRMQNMESDIWRQASAARLRTLPLAFEAKRLRGEERRAVATATRTITLTENDAIALRELHASSNPERISAIAPPFPHRLPAGRMLEGDPAIALSGSGGWWPNRQGTEWFLREVARRISDRMPRAVIHVFGGDAGSPEKNVRWHAAPVDSIDAFPEGAIAAVPLFVGSGIRMRILEAWARGLPVVATSIAARGLNIASGRELSIADTADDFCAALVSLAESREARVARIDAGRTYLTERHDPERMSRELIDVYQQAIAQRREIAQ